MREPFPGHHVFDRELCSGDPLFAKSGLSVSPTPLVILDGFEHHAKAAAPETTIGEQGRKFFADLRVVWPVPTLTGLATQIILDHVAGCRSVRLPHQRNKLR